MILRPKFPRRRRRDCARATSWMRDVQDAVIKALQCEFPAMPAVLMDEVPLSTRYFRCDGVLIDSVPVTRGILWADWAISVAPKAKRAKRKRAATKKR